MPLRLLAAAAAVCLIAPSALAAPPRAPKLTLINAGTGAKAPLRLALKKGTTQRISMTMLMDLKMSMSGADMPSMKMPATKMVMDKKVTEVSADKATIAMELTSMSAVDTPGVAPGMRDGMQAMLKGLAGLTGSYVTDARGVSSAMTLRPPAKASPAAQKLVSDMKSNFETLTVPLPVEAVGAGAKWSVEQLVDRNGMEIAQLVTYEVKQVDGPKVVLTQTVTQTAKPQQVELPGLGPDASARLLSLSGEGRGTITLDLTKPSPVAGDSKLQTSFKIAIEAMGKETIADMRLDMNIVTE